MRKTRDGFFSEKWTAKRDLHEQIREQGRAVIFVGSDRIGVVCPRNVTFMQEARALTGTWRPRSGQWTFTRHAFGKVQTALEMVFGKEKVSVQW